MQKLLKIRVISFLIAIITILSTFSVTPVAFAENANSGNTTVKNIIVMIPDGAGFGSFDIAEAVKLSGKGLAGMATPITTDTISGMTSEGLYLSNFLVGTAITRSSDSAVTDSAAGGTAIATGYKTNNGSVSVNSSGRQLPKATLLEASQIAGKSTGIVATMYWYDATPASFASHSASRSNAEQITAQMLNHNLDVVLGGGYGASYEKKIFPDALGYTVVKSRTELSDAVEKGATKVWSSFTEGSTESLVKDYQRNLNPEQPTLLEMTKAAIDILSKNTNNPNGFFLMVEGSNVDAGGHNNNALVAVSEYLAFDEAFAYAVEWAKNDGHTLVVGIPDHDTGGFTPIDEAETVEAISKGEKPKANWSSTGHTAQNVPIWAYGPDEVVNDLLKAMGLPTTGGVENARTGKYYQDVKFNSKYTVQNTALAHGVAKVAGLDLDAATKELFVDVTKMGTYENGTFTANNGITIPENANYYFTNDGSRVDFKYGVSVCSVNRFYVPYDVAKAVEATWNNPFPDVSENDYFYEAVEFVNTNGLFMGTDKGFEPYTPMTRAMYVTVLGRLAKADTSAYKTSTFPDVADGKWYTEYVGWANENKIVLGDNYGNFMPDSNITREQMMIVIYNYAKHLGKKTSMTATLGFADKDEIHSWAYDAVVYCVANGLVWGNTNNEIRPTEPATRADVAELMMNFSKMILE